ncbi:MAG TPA: chemotaxis protein CheW, partial [Stellaceae bacterium]|nr:chemotaxis protein CheW [Stellaceae bacterium]
AAAIQSFIVVEAAGRLLPLSRDAVVELIETVPWTRVPRAPPALLGIALLRGGALPIVSLAALLGLPQDRAPGALAATELYGHRLLLAIDRIVGLRQSAAGGEPADIAAMLPEEIRRIVLGFEADAEIGLSPASPEGGAAGEYLAFSLAGQDFAVRVACVDCIVEPRPLIPLPRPANAPDAAGAILGAIEWSGRILPVAALQSRLAGLGLGLPADWAPGAFVILRDDDGFGAVAVDRVKQVLRLRADEIGPPPNVRGVIEAVAAPAQGGPLFIIAPARLWGRE